jgi:hypothetical protein
VQLQAEHSELRSEYTKPWLQWAVCMLYVLALDLRRLQVAKAEDVDGIIERSPCLRGMRDVHFAKLLEKLLRLVGSLKVLQCPPSLPRPALLFPSSGLRFPFSFSFR